MKTTYFKTILLSSFVFIAASNLSCDKDNNDMNDGDELVLKGNADGSQEVPAVTTGATGTLDGSYDPDGNTLRYTISWTGLSGTVTVAHFHGPALAGANASPLHAIILTETGTTGTASGFVTLSDSEEQALLEGKIYYNLHTALHPGGEIRGQVMIMVTN